MPIVNNTRLLFALLLSWLAVVSVVDAAAVTQPSEIAELSASAASDRVSLRWAAIPRSTAERYDVYRDAKKIGSTSGTTFVDASVAPGASYQYHVTGNDLGGSITRELSSSLVTAIASAEAPVAKQLNVKKFGAAGDGIANDRPALARAIAGLAGQGGGTLLFPAGTYRVTTPGDGLVLADQSDVTLQFQAGAVLLMDNLDAAGAGTGHGIVVRGHAQHISLRGVKVRWAKTPRARSNGDGIRFEGYPNDARTLSSISMLGCSVENAPQTGSIFMGCSDVSVENFAVTNTLADGLHFNACRRVAVSGVTGINTGDDTLAFVTYYDPHRVNVYDVGPDAFQGPFAQPALGEWSNSSSSAKDVLSLDSRANAVRIDAASGLQLTNVIAMRSAVAGVQLDATVANGSTNMWTVQASQGVQVSGVYVNGADTGVFVHVQNADFNSDDRFWQFGVSFDNVNAVRCRNDNINISHAQGVSVNHLNSFAQRCRFIEDRDLNLDNINLHDGMLYLLGAAEPLTSMAQMPVNNYTIGAVTLTAGNALLQDLNGLTLKRIQVDSSPTDAITFNRVEAATVTAISVTEPAADSRAVLLSKLHLSRIDAINVDSGDAQLKSAIEIGGGDSTDVVDGLLIAAINWTSTLKLADEGIVVQGGPYSPKNWSATMQTNQKSKTLGSGKIPPELLKTSH